MPQWIVFVVLSAALPAHAARTGRRRQHCFARPAAALASADRLSDKAATQVAGADVQYMTAGLHTY